MHVDGVKDFPKVVNFHRNIRNIKNVSGWRRTFFQFDVFSISVARRGSLIEDSIEKLTRSLITAIYESLQSVERPLSVDCSPTNVKNQLSDGTIRAKKVYRFFLSSEGIITGKTFPHSSVEWKSTHVVQECGERKKASSPDGSFSHVFIQELINGAAHQLWKLIFLEATVFVLLALDLMQNIFFSLQNWFTPDFVVCR